ncbi:alpha/beta hydrolase-fold protein [Exiguobacterium sp. s168]|uniref:alpha/beta hydrolase n=1 Tax=Exiguobacterium sp. s168 TaxID=2751194 RepID=UPI001BEAA5AD|nr:alpha/beta hydrolase-fold protein [Exiguobacterium sp. s168]
MSITEIEMTLPTSQAHRTIRIHRPPHLDPSEALPVIYMHDGQNVFSGETASFGKGWEIHLALQKTQIPAMVVAIDSPEDAMDRYDDYAPWSDEALLMRTAYPSHRSSIGGNGKVYMDWIIRELKPYIDANYATRPDDTTMIGSSMGGVISLYGLFAYPEVITRVAALSTAGWANFSSLLEFIERSPSLSATHRCYMDVGTKEVSGPMTETDYLHTNDVLARAVEQKLTQSRYTIIPEAIHHETAWAERLPDILRYLFPSS